MPDRPYIAFGSSQFPTGTSVTQIDRGRSIGSVKRARATGMVQTIGYRNGIRVELNAPAVYGPLDQSDQWTRLQALRQMLAVGPSRLYVGRSDLYYRCCEPESEPEQIPETGLNRIHVMRIRMIGPDPFLYSTATTTETWVPTSGVVHTVNVIGGASAAPTFQLTVGGSGLETIAFTVSNDTTGEEFTLAGDVTAGDVIEVDCLLLKVKIGTTDYLTLFEGLFPSLSVGSNNITVSWTSSSVTSVTMTYQARYE